MNILIVGLLALIPVAPTSVSAVDFGRFAQAQRVAARFIEGDDRVKLRLEVAHNEERVWFHVMTDSLSTSAVTVQIGGDQGVPASAEVWTPVKPKIVDGGLDFVVGMACYLVDRSFVFLELGESVFVLDLWPFLIDLTDAIVVASLKHGTPCSNTDWRSCDLNVSRIIKGAAEERFRVPVYMPRFDDATEGVWLLHRDRPEGCDPDIGYRIIMFEPMGIQNEFVAKIMSAMESEH